MTTIKKKCWPKLFALVKSGEKKFDLRVADFKIKEGDTLILEEYDPKKKKYTGKKLTKKVKFLVKFRLDDFGQKAKMIKNGFYIIQI